MIQELPTPNTYKLWGVPFVLVLHTTLGSFQSAVDWLRTTPEERLRRYGRTSYSSAHRVFGRTGDIARLAGVNAGTWHSGGTEKPSQRALDILPKTVTGALKNPNRYTIGYEFASGWDIDRDGVIEKWEKMYTPEMVKASVTETIEVIEPEIEKVWGKKIIFASHNVLTHKDIAIYKPDLEIQRSMFLAELDRQRNKVAVLVPDIKPPEDTIKLQKQYQSLLVTYLGLLKQMVARLRS